MTGARIAAVTARQILDSRGRPTVEADVRLASGAVGSASVPSGASTGRHEAHELRDGNPHDYAGKSVRQAVAHVMGEIAAAVTGRNAHDQRDLDAVLRKLDGTANLQRLGANAILSVSLAVARAAAAQAGVPLHTHIARLAGATPTLPLPMVNILSGGAHANRGMDFQDFLVVPIGAEKYSSALDMAIRVRGAATEIAADRGLPILLADEGGLSPGYTQARAALDLMMDAIRRAGLVPGRDAAIAIDVAATELHQDGSYRLAGEARTVSSAAMAAYVGELVSAFPIVSVEDPLGEDDWEHWTAFRSGTTCQVIGDDLFATNEARIAEGAHKRAANAALIKLNQNGTLTGTLDAIQAAKRVNFATIVSARSGETEDAFIADLAVGAGAGQIKIGSVRNSERLAKYNQLLRIEGSNAFPFAGRHALATRL